MSTFEPPSPRARAQHERWLLEITQIPTAAGREFRVERWIEAWAKDRPAARLTRDACGNMVLRLAPGSKRGKGADARPLWITAHLDHPAFVVERIVAPGVLEVSFRGGVMDEYFREARIEVFDAHGTPHAGTITGETSGTPPAGAPPAIVKGAASPFKHYLVELDGDDETAHANIAVGDVGRWLLERAQIIDGLIHTDACDDLAAVAAALSAFDVLIERRKTLTREVCLLFTLAEEIGFVGAIGACRARTVPTNARVINLENSRSFAESPIGGGPIVRVGDRISVFSPTLTDAVARRAEEIAGGPSTPTAAQKNSDVPAWKWQRKLMAGGACESSVFVNAGYESTCVCLPLGNYHNMANLAEVQAGTFQGLPRVAREFVSVADYHNMVDLLIACGERLPAGGSLDERLEKLWNERSFVLPARPGRGKKTAKPSARKPATKSPARKTGTKARTAARSGGKK
ncbi:MAG: hypothetical protein SFY95_03210 [Planctomycetota bacterium]|nr:hypothetical protein [Planctomycetota bacterium]